MGFVNPTIYRTAGLENNNNKTKTLFFSYFVTQMSTTCFFLILLKIGPGLILNMSPGTVVCHVGDKMENLDPS